MSIIINSRRATLAHNAHYFDEVGMGEFYYSYICYLIYLLLVEKSGSHQAAY